MSARRGTRSLRSALIASAAIAALGASATTASALPGDPGIDSSAPQRLNAATLEPGCFDLGRAGYWFSNVDASSFDAKGDYLPDGELVLKNKTGSRGVPSFDIDQVLVPSKFGGYKVYNSFDVGSGANENAPSISNGETGVEMFAPDANGNGNPDPIDANDIIVCLSDDSSASQNEPYALDDASGLVYAKNRPIVAPKVTALGVSAVEPLNTYKVGFGYAVEKWYSAPSFDGHGLFPTVTDPNAVPSPTAGGNLPAFVRMDPRPDFPYDALRVNDVDAFGDEWEGGQQAADRGQTRKFKATGDDTAWSLSNNNETDTLAHLITFTAQGDLPLTWALRPSLASPASRRAVTIDYAFLANWNKQWQDYYDCKGPLPSLPLAPGTNSPASDDGNDCNAPVSAPAQTSTAPASTTSTTTIIQQVSPASSAVRSTTAAKAVKTAVRSARILRTKSGRVLQVYVRSAGKSARIKITMYGANGRKVGQVTKTVATNRTVKVTGVRVGKKVKTVKVALA
jgi:hypothetical protein